MPTSKEELIRRGIPLHDIQHNQHRRADWRDYGGCGLYMVTLCTEGRQALFGHLMGDIRAKRGSADFPHIILSPLGQAILNEELPKIHRIYPQIEMWQATVMPDHLHLLLYVAEPLPNGKKLGDVIRSFKGGCSRAWWAMAERAATGTAQQGAGTTAEAKAGTAGEAGRGTALKGAGTTAAAETKAGAAGVGVPVLSSTVQRPSLFEAGYHDRIIMRPGMLETIKRYMSDNPLRALMRRQLPHLMERCLHLRIGGHDYAAFGALFLLKRAEKEQVFYHRRDKATGLPTEQTDEYKQERERQLAEARAGVVLVSPAISKGEQLVINTAIEEGLPVIHLQKEPITRYWKPERRRFEACARGALLILAPWDLDEELLRERNAAETAGRGTALKGAGTTAAGTSAGTAAEGTKAGTALKGAGTTATGTSAGTTATGTSAGTAAAGTSAGTTAEAKAGTAGETAVSDYARFHRLNDLAGEICETTDAVLLNVGEIR